MNVGRKVLFGVSLPWTLTVSYPWVLLACALGFAEKLRLESGGVLTAQWRVWFAKKWHYSTTLGYGMIFHPSADRGDLDKVDTRIEKHERIHTFQTQDMMALSLVLGLVDLAVTGDPWYALLKWWTGGLFQLPNFLTSVLRHGTKAYRVKDLSKSWLKRLKENAYRQSEHERSAYAQTDLVAQVGGHDVSWRELQDQWLEYQKGNREAWERDNP